MPEAALPAVAATDAAFLRGMVKLDNERSGEGVAKQFWGSGAVLEDPDGRALRLRDARSIAQKG
jgi:hypothetical protein